MTETTCPQSLEYLLPGLYRTSLPTLAQICGSVFFILSPLIALSSLLFSWRKVRASGSFQMFVARVLSVE